MCNVEMFPGSCCLTCPERVHCSIYFLQQTATEFPTLNLPDVCTDSPVRGKAFCRDHCALLGREAPDVPTDLREFLKFCGAKANGMCICITTIHF